MKRVLRAAKRINSVSMTERYAHLRPDLYPPEDLGTIAIDLRPGRAKPASIGYRMGTGTPKSGGTQRNQKKMVRAAL